MACLVRCWATVARTPSTDGRLAAGAGDMDYAGPVVVSGWTLDELRAAVGQITTAAAKAHRELRVLYGESRVRLD